MAYHLSVVEIIHEINQQDTPPSPKPRTPEMSITRVILKGTTMGKNRQKKLMHVRGEDLPSDYPYGDILEESISDYARRIGKNKHTVRTQADVGDLPILQTRPGAKRRVNLYAIYLNAKRNAERYVDRMGK